MEKYMHFNIYIPGESIGLGGRGCDGVCVYVLLETAPCVINFLLPPPLQAPFPCLIFFFF